MIWNILRLPGSLRVAIAALVLCAMERRVGAQEAATAAQPKAAAEAPAEVGADSVTNAPAAAPAAKSAETLRVQPKRLKDFDLPGLDTKITLDSMTPWDVVQLIEFLAYKGGLNNIVISRGVAGLTTKLKFSDVAVGDALDVVLSVNNLAYELNSGIITIMTDAEYKAKTGVSFYDQKQVRVVDLKYGDPERIAKTLEAVKSEIGTVAFDRVTATLILIDTPDRMREMEAIIGRADMATVSRVLPTETRIFVLQYATPEEIRENVAAIITRDVGTIRVDNRTKTLIVSDLPHNLPRIEALVKAFDKRSKEVFIEAKIVQVALNDTFNMGINWNHVFEAVDPRFSLSSNVRPPIGDMQGGVTASGMGVGSLTYRTILAGGDLNVILDVLKHVGRMDILNNTHVAVVDGNEATIKTVRNEPYAETQLEGGTTNVVGTTLRFIEVGVSLAVKPRISDDGFISMAIRPEMSAVVRNYAAHFMVPVVQRSYAETTVMIKDGETIIIGGMIQNQKGREGSRVPLLGGIPVLGRLFRSDSESSETREMIVFLTPRIISGDEPVQLMRDAPKPPKGLRPVGGMNGKELKPIR
jgi:type II secretory pathway component GspD/PulD (secretin)